MFLKKLEVISSKIGVIREIYFHKGVNLVIDKSTSNRNETGNGVGKTTLLRSIDFCLGAEQNNFYTDPEFKVENPLIKDFLIDNEVEFKLTFGTDIQVQKSSDVVIARKITSTTNKTRVLAKINELEYKNTKDFNEALKMTFFLDSSKKPTFREIMGRLIRNTPVKMSNALHTLTMGSNSKYETLNLFMFGFGNSAILDEKQNLANKLKQRKSEYDFLNKGRSKNSLEQALAVIQAEIVGLEKQFINYDFSDSYEKQMSELNRIKIDVNEISLELSSLEMKKSLNEKAIETLEKNHEKINPADLQNLYDEAADRLGGLNKEFEDLLLFHNKMLNKKISFIRTQMQPLLKEILLLRNELDLSLEKEKDILKELSSHGSLGDLQIIQKRINTFYEEKGSVEGLLKQISEHEDKYNHAKDSYEKICQHLTSKMDSFNEKLGLFNVYFAAYTRELYNEEYILSYKESSGNYVFTVEPLGTLDKLGNQGEGKKKAQVAALDFAYLSVQEQLCSRTPRFIAHDGIEAIHTNQISTLFEIASGIDGQYILAILKDKLDSVSPDFIAKHLILELSENDKFFRL